MDSQIKNEGFIDILNSGVESGVFETDDVLAAIIPLMEQVMASHDAGKVAPLNGLEALHSLHNVLWFQQDEALKPKKNGISIYELSHTDNGIFMEVVGRQDHTLKVDEMQHSSQNLRVWDSVEKPTTPVYVTAYSSWEQLVAHHDALTDIFSLGRA